MGDDWFDLDFATQLEKAKAKGRETDTNLELDGITRELELTHEVYDKLIEKKLMQPTFVTRIPHEFVPLAKACKDDPSLVDVFEFVVAGRELCPGYTEQNDPLEPSLQPRRALHAVPEVRRVRADCREREQLEVFLRVV